MIQRYSLSVEPQTGCEWAMYDVEFVDIEHKEDDNGEWVKWDDVKHLFAVEITIKSLEEKLKIIKDGLKNDTAR